MTIVAGLKAAARFLLAVFLVTAGIAHLVVPETFLAQTPSFLPWRPAIVLISGLMEIALGLALVVLPRWRAQVGAVTAAFFVAIFPGNLYQAIAGIDAFGLDSPAARWTRLAFQPLLVAWAWWSTRPDRRPADPDGDVGP